MHNVEASDVNHQENYNTLEEDDYLFTVNSDNRSISKPMFLVNLNGVPTRMLGDSGASVNVIDEPAFHKIKPSPSLQKPDMNLFPYGPKQKPISLLGMFTGTFVAGTDTATDKVYVARGSYGTLLCHRTADMLNLIKINKEAVVANVVTDETTQTIVEEFKDRFQGLGKVKGVRVQLHLNPDIKPVIQPHRRIPFHLRQKVKEELQHLEEMDVIERVTQPSSWVSPLVVAPKPKNPNAVRLCVDMRRTNEAVLRERHVMPTVDDVINDLNGATVFSKLDLNQGYHQLELTPESRDVTTFSTQDGLWRYKRLNFGISAASEIFQHTIAQALTGLDGVKNMSDDIIIFGKTKEEHDRNLRNVLTRLRDQNITLRREKCEFNRTELKFYGFVFSDKGMTADPEKIKAISNLEKPTTIGELKSFLGMTNYCSRFIQNYSDVTEPLRQLTHEDTPWSWGKTQDSAFDQVKDMLMRHPTLAYFDPSKKTSLAVDASPTGLGGILTQEDSKGTRYTVAYASKALSDVERRYSQTEREALAIIWACEHYHLYIYGQPITVFTDHKPLLGMFNKPGAKLSARVERWAIRLQPYDVTLEYQKGSDNPADYMSRHPDKSTQPTARASKFAEEYVNFLSDESRPVALTEEDLISATQKDETLLAVTKSLTTGNWDPPEVTPYLNVKDELSLTKDGLILRGTRICVPKDLQDQTVELAHLGHQGITRTKALIREKVWFPNIDKLVEEKVRNCLPCQVSCTNTNREPLKMTHITRPWEEVSVDFADVGNGYHIMVLVDDFTRYPEVEVLSSLTARAVIPKLEGIFARWGVPRVVKSDNGPPFQSKEFADYAKTSGFRQRRVTPLWPEANGEAERFVKTIKKPINAAKMSNKNWQYEMNIFLRNYRATPHASTKIPPATAMIGRPIRTGLPQNTQRRATPIEREVKRNDLKAKQTMKDHADKKRHTQPSNIKVGDNVIILRKDGKKRFDPEIYKVIKVNGSQIQARRGERVVTRNSSFFKVVNCNQNQKRKENEDDEYDIDLDINWNNNAPHPGPVDQNGQAGHNNQQLLGQQLPAQRPVRNRRPPNYLNDYVR